MKTRKMLALLLALSMVLGMFTAVSFADTPDDLPTATVTKISQSVLEAAGAPPLTFALQFVADKPEDEELTLKTYGDWYADFVLTVNKAATFNADESANADAYLAGQYNAWSDYWLSVPSFGMDTISLAAGESIKIMDTAAKLLGQSGLKLTYADVYHGVKVFNCGIFFTEEYLEANPISL